MLPVTTILFYIFSAILLGAATFVVTARNPVYATLYLVLVFLMQQPYSFCWGRNFWG